LLYKNGLGVKQDYALAFKWFSKAAVQGFAVAQYNLAWLYENGFGIQQDYVMACNWFSKAAEQGNVRAQYNLACKYEKVLGVPQDYDVAREWYTRAEELGHTEAQHYLTDLLITEQITSGIVNLFNYAKEAAKNIRDYQSNMITSLTSKIEFC